MNFISRAILAIIRLRIVFPEKYRIIDFSLGFADYGFYLICYPRNWYLPSSRYGAIQTHDWAEFVHRFRGVISSKLIE